MTRENINDISSPFVPDTQLQFAWDSTSLGWLKECPRKYQYSMIDGWQPLDHSVHLVFGILYHTGLETYDKARALGKTKDEALVAAIRRVLTDSWSDETSSPWNSDNTKKTRETLVRSIIWYYEKWHDDPATTIILDNGAPAVELSFRFEIDMDNSFDGTPYMLSGHMDRFVNFNDTPYVMDYKTSGNKITSYFFDQFTPNNQMSLYTLAAQIVYKTPAHGVIIDGAQLAVGFTEFGRGIAHRTPSQLSEWLVDTKEHLKAAEHYAENNYWPMNDKSCHNFGGCQFREICSKSPEVREDFLQANFQPFEWNPIKAR